MLSPRWPSLREMTTEMNQLHREMNRLFGRFTVPYSAAWPALNVWEDENAFYAEAELPGMELSDLEIEVADGNRLTLKGERKAPLVEKGAWHRQERTYGQFERSVELPSVVDIDQIEARLAHGVLLVRLPKSEKAKARRIEVKAE